MLKGITLKGFMAVVLLTVGAFAVVGGIAVIILGAIEGSLEIGLGGVITAVVGAIAGYAGSWLYDEENMDEET